MKLVDKKIKIVFAIKDLLICGIILMIYLSAIHCVSFIYDGFKYHTSVLDFKLDSYIRLYCTTGLLYLFCVILGIVPFNIKAGSKCSLSNIWRNINSKVPIIIAMVMSVSIVKYLASLIIIGPNNNIDYMSLLFRNYNYFVLLLVGFVLSVLISSQNVKNHRRNGLLEFLFYVLIAGVNVIFILNLIHYVDAMFAYPPFYDCLLFYTICIAIFIILEIAISVFEHINLSKVKEF